MYRDYWETRSQEPAPSPPAYLPETMPEAVAKAKEAVRSSAPGVIAAALPAKERDRLQVKQQQQKKRKKKNSCLTFFYSHKFHKIEIYFFLKVQKNSYTLEAHIMFLTVSSSMGGAARAR